VSKALSPSDEDESESEREIEEEELKSFKRFLLHLGFRLCIGDGDALVGVEVAIGVSNIRVGVVKHGSVLLEWENVQALSVIEMTKVIFRQIRVS
jgi:hypothetical protein